MDDQRIDLEETASGGLYLTIWYEDGGMDQIWLSEKSRAELRAWLNKEVKN